MLYHYGDINSRIKQLFRHYSEYNLGFFIVSPSILEAHSETDLF